MTVARNDSSKAGWMTGTAISNWLRTTWGHNVHKGYFSIDKRTGHSVDSKLKRDSDESDDISAYDLILKNKERLLSFKEDTRFIFSHSALREGWDNPNVFQVCTLKHSDNEISKRQEVGRGLRLCVNKDGVRQDLNVLGEGTVQEVNLLTVIASESYEKFAEALQKDIKSEPHDRPIKIDNAFLSKVSIPAEQVGPGYEGVEPATFTPEESNTVYLRLYKHDLIDESGKLTGKFAEYGLDEEFVAELSEALQAKAPAVQIVLKSVLENVTGVLVGNVLKQNIGRNDLNDNSRKKAFQELWERINHKYVYTALRRRRTRQERRQGDQRQARGGEALVRRHQEGIRSRRRPARIWPWASISDVRRAAATRAISTSTRPTASNTTCSAKSAITQSCAARILKGIRPDKFRMFRDNPEQFIAKVSRLIIGQKAAMIVDHISYDRIQSEYDSTIFANASGRDEADAIRVSANACRTGCSPTATPERAWKRNSREGSKPHPKSPSTPSCRAASGSPRRSVTTLPTGSSPSVKIAG